MSLYIISASSAQLYIKRALLLCSTIFALFAVLTRFSPALAQETASASQPIELPPVVVSATTIPTPASEIANSVTVITGDQIENEQLRMLPGALAPVPGLNVVQTGGPGGQTSVFIRGTNSNQVKVLVDGIDVTDPSNPNQSFDFGQFLNLGVDRIEVLRGPQGGLYGADAIGGVISITTKPGSGPPTAYGQIEGGSFGTFNQLAGFSGSTPKINYAFDVEHFQVADTPVTPLDLLPPGRQRIDDFYDNMTYSTKLGVNVSDNVGVNFVARYIDSTLKFTGDDFSVSPSVPAASQSTQVDHQFLTRGEVVLSTPDNRFANYFGVGYTNAWTSNLGPDVAPSVNDGQRIKFDWRGVALITQGETLVMGLEDELFSLEETDIPSAFNADKAAYLELQSQFTQHLFMVSNIRFDDNDAFGDHDTFRIAPAYIVPWTNTELKASYGTGFKAPTLSELYVNFPAFGFFANPNLQPETSRGYDYGFEQPIANGRFSFGATYFHNDLTDLIDTNATFTSYANIGRATTYGVESFASLVVSPSLTLREDYTYTIAKDDTTGEELLRRPINKASFTATWKPTNKFNTSLIIIDAGSWRDVNRSGTETGFLAPGYQVVNLAANYAISNHYTLFGRIDNLLNHQYEDPTGFDRPGFGIFGGIRVTMN